MKVSGTLNVLNAANKVATVRKVVLTSSCAAVNEGHDPNLVFNETSWTSVEDKNVDPYAKSKTLAEKAAWDYVNDIKTGNTFALTAVNPKLVFGPMLISEQGASISLIRRFLNGEMPLTPPLNMGCVDVRDVAIGHLEAMRRPETDGERILLTHTPSYWFRDIARELGREFRKQGYWIPRYQAASLMVWLYSFIDAEAAASLPRPKIEDELPLNCGDYILHVASPFPSVADESFIQIAINGTLNVLNAANKVATVRKVVLTSSCAAVNEGHDPNLVFNETSWTSVEDKNVDPYAKSKTLAEKAAWDYVNDIKTGNTFALTAVNPKLVFGPMLISEQGASISLIRRFLNGEMPLTPPLNMGCVDVRDVAIGHLEAMRRPETDGERILLTHTPSYWFRDIARELGREFRKQGYWIPRYQAASLMVWLYSFIDAEAAASLPRPKIEDELPLNCGDYILHVASPFPSVADESFIQIAINGTLNVLNAANKVATVRKVVLTSSCAAVNEGHDPNLVFNETSWTSVEDKNVDPYAKSKTLAEKAAWDYVNDIKTGNTFALTAVNPKLVFGPMLISEQGASISLIRRFLNGEMPLTPPLNMGCVDVRDVAIGHLEAMRRPETDGERILLTHTPSYWFRDIARELGREFRKQGYWIPRYQAASLMVWLYSFIDAEAAASLPRLGNIIKFDNSKAERLLNLKFREPDFVGMGYTIIERGIVTFKRTK